MTKTKEIIREILEHREIEQWRSISRNKRVIAIMSEFGVSRGVANNVSNNLSTYDAQSLYFIYFPELREVF